MNLFRRAQSAQAAEPRFSFCEAVTATPLSPHHIRRLTDAGMKTGGGADTAALCGRDLNMGWDVTAVQGPEQVQQMVGKRVNDRLLVCGPCADAYAYAKMVTDA